MNLKRIIRANLFLLILYLVVFFLYGEAFALEEQIIVTVRVNGNCIKMDSKPYIKDNRTFIPIRIIAQALGADVKWVDEEKKAIITVTPEGYDESTVDKTIVGATDGIKTIELFVGSNEIIVNSEKKVVDASVEIANGRVMVPLRVVSENLDCSVEWNESTFTVSVNKPDVVVPEECIENRSYTDEDLLWLARIVHVEGKGLSINGRLAIANVVVNRKNSPRFPNTIYDVIFAPGQFPPAHKNGFKELVPTRGCIIAAKMALEGINNVEDCMFFNHKPFNSKNIKLYKRIDGEYFYQYK